MIPYKQLTLAKFLKIAKTNSIMTNISFFLYFTKPLILMKLFLFLLLLIFHASHRKTSQHPLYPMIKVLLIQRIFSIPTDTLLIIF